MPYEFNPLIKDCFQKKSEVSPSDIQQLQAEISDLQESSEKLDQKKVTKFFSANDTFLENNEIAEYQSEDDSVNELKKGFFYLIGSGDVVGVPAEREDALFSQSVEFLNYVNSQPSDILSFYVRNIETTFPKSYAKIALHIDSHYNNETIYINGILESAVSSTVAPNVLRYQFGNNSYIISPFAYSNEGNIYTVNIVDSHFYINDTLINVSQWAVSSDMYICYDSAGECYAWVPFVVAPYFSLGAFKYSENSGIIGFTLKPLYIRNNYRWGSLPETTLRIVTDYNFIISSRFTRTNTQPALIWSAYDSNDSEPRFINLDSLTALENIKFSYTPSNDYYITYDNLIAQQGTPDIRYLDYCIINSLGAIYTHGQFLLANKSVDDYQYNGSVYGVQWDTEDTSPECTRIGNLSLHATLPVHNQIVGGLLTDDGTFSPFPIQTDWTTETRDGSLGQVMVKIPEFWYKFITEVTINKVLFSAVPVLGFKKSPEMFISAYQAAVDRVNLKLSSVVNNSVNFRGGNNIAAWDNTYRDLLGRPATSINLTNFRTYARNRHTVDGNPDTRWNCMTYEAQRLLYWLFVVEFATLNTQKPFNAELTGEGFKQGGLGNGVSMWTDSAWNSFNSFNPFVPCGYTDEFGNTTNIKTYNVRDVNNNILYAAEVPRYRGIENPFAHIWQWTDGILVEVSSGGNSAVFIQTDCDKFSSYDYSEYEYIGNQVRSDNFIKGIIFGNNGDIIANKFAGNSATYYCDFYYGSNLPTSGVSVRGCYFGGGACYGARCGLVCGDALNAPDFASVAIGSRLCFKA